MARVHDMGEPGDFGSESAEVGSVEAGMNLTKYSNEDLFEEIARRHYAVVILYMTHTLPDLSTHRTCAPWMAASMAYAFIDRLDREERQ